MYEVSVCLTCIRTWTSLTEHTDSFMIELAAGTGEADTVDEMASVWRIVAAIRRALEQQNRSLPGEE